MWTPHSSVICPLGDLSPVSGHPGQRARGAGLVWKLHLAFWCLPDPVLGGTPTTNPQGPTPLGILWVLVFGALPMPLGNLHSLFPVMGSERYMSSSMSAGGLWAPEV